MKGPICAEDAKKGKLCSRCKEKLEQGEISKLDFQVMKELGKLEQTHILFDVAFLKSFEFGEMLILMCEGNIGVLIGKEGKVIKELSKNMDRKVRIVGKSYSEKKMVQDLLGNVRVLGVNKVFTPEEDALHKVMLAKQDRKNLLVPEKELSGIIGNLIDGKIEVGFV